MIRPKRVAIYVRVSTPDQNTRAQETELKAFAANRGWVIHQIFSDTGSGAKDDRPGLKALMGACRQRKVDGVLVWKFDRFARSLRHLVSALEEFKRLGIDFVSATEGIDTSVPSGELVFAIFGAIAQFERTLIAERVKSGIAEARRSGKRLGRPPIRQLLQADVAAIRRDRESGEFSLRELATKHRTSLWAVYQASRGIAI